MEKACATWHDNAHYRFARHLFRQQVLKALALQTCVNRFCYNSLLDKLYNLSMKGCVKLTLVICNVNVYELPTYHIKLLSHPSCHNTTHIPADEF